MKDSPSNAMIGALSAPNAAASRRTWYVLAVLTATYSVNFLDRQVVNILAESIKRDLQISDTQLGLLTGTAFGLFYSILGLPIARLADRVSRVKIIAAALTLWSALTAVCGFAQSYAQLFLLRLGVGVGEAGGTPPAQSLIADYFPHRTRTMAMAVFALGVPLGSFLGFLIGGYVDRFWGWRTAFFVAGLPGLVLAALVYFTIREPQRGLSDGVQAAAVDAVPPLRDGLGELFRRRSFIRLVLGGTCGIFVIYVTNAWLPSFFIRLHGLNAGEVGGWIALCVGLGGLIGSVGGGWIVSRIKPRFARAEIWIMAISTALVCPALLSTLLASSTAAALASMFVLYTLSYVWIGPTLALIQHVAPVRSRALAAGIQLSVANIIAMLAGPPLIGYLSDLWRPELADESLRYALLTVCVVTLVGSALYLSAGKHVLKDGSETG